MAQATAPILDSIWAAEQGCPHSRRVLERKRTTRGRSHRPLDQDVISFPPHELTPRGRVTWRPASDGENS
jgi:hypothetical protein